WQQFGNRTGSSAAPYRLGRVRRGARSRADPVPNTKATRGRRGSLTARGALPFIASGRVSVMLLSYRTTINDHAAARDSDRSDDRGDSPGGHANGFSPFVPTNRLPGASPSRPPLRKDGEGARHPVDRDR